MRNATTDCKPNQGPTVTIENFGTCPQSIFASILFNAGKLTLKQFISAKKIKFSNEFATQLVNENSSLFPSQF